MNWREIKAVGRSFRNSGPLEVAQQVFFRLVWWLNELMGDEAGRDWMVSVVDTEPVTDWETGFMLGDPCQNHPAQELSSVGFYSEGHPHLECIECASQPAAS